MEREDCISYRNVRFLCDWLSVRKILSLDKCVRNTDPLPLLLTSLSEGALFVVVDTADREVSIGVRCA